MCLPDHIGTHIDAPSTFYRGGISIDEIPLENLVDIPVAKVDVTKQAADNPEYALRISDVTDWENENGRLPARSLLFVDSGWGEFYGDRVRYIGTETDDRDEFAFPAFSTEVIQWLIDERDIVGVGIDTYAIEDLRSKTISSSAFYYLSICNFLVAKCHAHNHM